MTKRNHLGYQVDSSRESRRPSAITDRFALEVYQAFMTGYVRRINEATLGVTIGGVRIGSAKYSRLAQINLNTRIITFSRYAIENVPERGRRYLVIHELAHVKEASHNKKFWEIVARYEPNYRQIGRSLELAFKRNVKEAQLSDNPVRLPNPLSGRLEEPKLLLSRRLSDYNAAVKPLSEATNVLPGADLTEPEDGDYLCTDEEFGGDYEPSDGIIYGGWDMDLATITSN